MGLIELHSARIIDLAMRHEALDQYRRKAIYSARGVVLEIGVGSGMNLPLYGRAVDRVYALDPLRELLGLAASGREMPC
jgi:protein-L-isoaspartate O-methyltransferase